jgi:hypothetical protein
MARLWMIHAKRGDSSTAKNILNMLCCYFVMRIVYFCTTSTSIGSLHEEKAFFSSRLVLFGA